MGVDFLQGLVANFRAVTERIISVVMSLGSGGNAVGIGGVILALVLVLLVAVGGVAGGRHVIKLYRRVMLLRAKRRPTTTVGLSSGEPADPEVGDSYIDTNTLQVLQFDGAHWVQVALLAGPSPPPAPSTAPVVPTVVPVYAEFSAALPPDNSYGIAPGITLAFPTAGVTSGVSGSAVTAVGSNGDTWQLPANGATYEVSWQLPLTQPGLGQELSTAAIMAGGGGGLIATASTSAAVIDGDIITPIVTAPVPADLTPTPPYGIISSGRTFTNAFASLTVLQTYLNGLPGTPLTLNGLAPVVPGVYTVTGSVVADLTFTGAGLYVFQFTSLCQLPQSSTWTLSGGANPSQMFWVCNTLSINANAPIVLYGTFIANHGITISNSNSIRTAIVGGLYTVNGTIVIADTRSVAVYPPVAFASAPVAYTYTPYSIGTAGQAVIQTSTDGGTTYTEMPTAVASLEAPVDLSWGPTLITTTAANTLVQVVNPVESTTTLYAPPYFGGNLPASGRISFALKPTAVLS